MATENHWHCKNLSFQTWAPWHDIHVKIFRGKLSTDRNHDAFLGFCNMLKLIHSPSVYLVESYFCHLRMSVILASWPFVWGVKRRFFLLEKQRKSDQSGTLASLKVGILEPSKMMDFVEENPRNLTAISPLKNGWLVQMRKPVGNKPLFLGATNVKFPVRGVECRFLILLYVSVWSNFIATSHDQKPQNVAIEKEKWKRGRSSAESFGALWACVVHG